MTSQDDERTAPAEIGDPGDCVTPFEPKDVLRLERFVRRVDELGNTPFGRPPNEPIEMRGLWTDGLMHSIEFDGPDSHATQHMAAIFRELYSGTEPSSGTKISSLIGRHAAERGTAAGKKLADDMKAFRKAFEWRKSEDRRLGILGEGVGPPNSPDQMTPEQVVDLFLYGELLHYDADKAAILAEDPQHTMMMRVMFLSTVRDLVQMWRNLANWTVRPILNTPGLTMPASDAADSPT